MAHHVSALTLLTVGLLSLTGCESGDPPAADSMAPETPARAAEVLPEAGPLQDWQRDILAHCRALIDRFRASTDTLNGQIAQFTSAPSEDSRVAALSSWRQTLSAWGAASLCLHSPLPEASPVQHSDWYARTAAAPAMAGFIDTVPGFDSSGIVHDETVSLTLENLNRQHQVTDDGEVALGLYALEVLLFGAVPRTPDDYAPAADIDSVPLTEQSHQARRSRMTALLALDLAHQAQQWQGYWQTLTTPATAEADASSVLWQWSRALEDMGRLMPDGDVAQPGLALEPAHDELYLDAALSALGHWWAQATTLEQIENLGLSATTWRDAGAQLMAADRASIEEAARMLRDLSRRLELVGSHSRSTEQPPRREEEPS